MMWLGHGFGLFGLACLLGAGLLKLLFFGALIALIVLALRSRREHPMHQATGGGALEALNARYARGEVTKAEYDQIRQDISR